MNHAARFLTDAETICKQIPREKIELLADGLAQLRERGGRLFLLGVGGSAVAKYVVPTPEIERRVVEVFNRYPDRFLFGTESVAPADQAAPTAVGFTTWHGFASRAVAIQAPLSGRNPRVTAITTAEYHTAARRPINSRFDCRLFARVFGICGRHWTEGVDITTRALVAASAQRAHVA